MTEKTPQNVLRMAVLASGGGSNWKAILEKVQEGQLDASITWVLSNNSASGALVTAQEAGIPALHVSSKTEGSEEGVEARIVQELENSKVDLIVLAGYMKKVPPKVLDVYKNRIVNIHPALLPAFGGQGWYGKHIHKGVLDRGCQVTGITIHLVNGEYDQGPILLQKTVPVASQDTVESLAAKVLQVEHRWYWRVLKGFAERILFVEDGDVRGLEAFRDSVG
jgi:phosphoribosylglycinamide formyltransferase-1